LLPPGSGHARRPSTIVSKDRHGAECRVVPADPHDLGEAITLADCVVVFSARPGRIRTIRSVDLLRPCDVFRIRFTEAFAHLNEELWDELKDEAARGTDV
jgi:ABC-type taurine transport system ATPase subunit